MLISNTADTKTAKILLGDDGIIRIIFVSELRTDEDVKENITVIDQIENDKIYPLFIDMSKINEITPEYEKYYELLVAVNSVSVIAILSGSTIINSLALFFKNVSILSGSPKKLFNDESKALQWLKNIFDMNLSVQQYARRNNISILELIETSSTDIILGDDLIIRALAFDETQTIDDAKEVITAVNNIAGNKKYPVLIDSSKVKEMTPESRTYYQSKEAVLYVSAIAIIITSGMSRVTADFFVGLQKLPGTPRKLFNEENKARQWLKNYTNSSTVAAKSETDQSNILIYEPINQIQKPIVYSLIKNGIRCLCLQEKKEILSKLKTNKYNSFICSCSPETKDIIDIIKEIKLNKELSFVKVILLTAPTSKKYLEYMIQLGIKGIILKPFVQEVFEKKILKLLFRDNMLPDRRQTIRVEPDSDDRTIIAIRTSITHKTIVGKLKSISMDGMVIELTGSFIEDDIKENDVIANNNIKITINENEISTNGIIYTRKLNIVVIKFIEMQEYYQNMLSSYIYKRMNL